MTANYIVMPDKQDAERINKVIREIDNCLLQIQAHKDYIKEAKKALKDDYQLTPSAIALMIKLYHKNSAEEYFKTQEELNDLYDTIFGGEK